MLDKEDIAAAAERLVRERWGAVGFGARTTLDGSDRAYVARWTLHGPPPTPASIIVKAPDPETAGEAVVREPAALQLLAGGSEGPDLLAVGTAPPLLLMSDLAAGAPANAAAGAPTDPATDPSPSSGLHAGTDVADALLGTDPGAAVTAVSAWAEAIGRLHACTTGRAADLDRSLRAHAARLGRPVPPTDPTPRMLADAADALAGHLPALGVAPAPAALDELRGLDGRLGGGAGARALTPADACPDNNLFTRDGATGAQTLTLLDFEGAGIRHIAWDAAYLRVPWPSCWCSWRIPTDVANAATQKWLDRVGSAVPYARTPPFSADLSLATVGWCLTSTAWLLPAALAGDPPTVDRCVEGLMPRRRPLIAHRLGIAARGAAGALSDLAAELLAATVAAWGRQELLPAPAFR